MFAVDRIGRICRLVGVVLVLCLAPCAVSLADLYTYDFVRITNNSFDSLGNPVDVASQLSVDVSDVGTTQVLFTVRNVGPLGSSITEIYFDEDGTDPTSDHATMLTLVGIFDTHDAGVDFEPITEDVKPANLPGGTDLSPAFVALTALSTEPDNDTTDSGIDPGEYVGLLFDIASTSIFNDVISALDLAYTDPGDLHSLRVGLHVRSLPGFETRDGVYGYYDDAASDSFVTTPVPGAVLLGSMGLTTAGYFLRRKKSLTQ